MPRKRAEQTVHDRDLLDEALESQKVTVEDSDPEAQPQAAPDAAVKDELLRLLQDPDIANQAVQTALGTAEGRKALNVPLGVGAPVGEYQRSYHGEEHLRVHGGVEVAHENGFVPLPPAYITKYEAKNGQQTNYEPGQAAAVRMDALEPLLDDGGRPIKTEQYRFFLDRLVKGERLDGNVRSDMAAGVFAADGTPRFQADDPGMGPTREG